MIPPAEKSTGIAAIDISSGFAGDTAYELDRPRDPWAEQCLATILDTAINHLTITYPLPSRAAGDLLPGYVPRVFKLAEHTFGLKPIITKYADDRQIRLSDDDLFRELVQFRAAMEGQEGSVRAWAELHRLSDNVVLHNRAHVRERPRPAWWDKELEQLSRERDVELPSIEYAFDVFARTIEYLSVLGGDVPFFAHPIRAKALSSLASESAAASNVYSFGRFLAHAGQQRGRGIAWAMEQAARVKDASRGATWYSLQTLPRAEMVDAVLQIAYSGEADQQFRIDGDHYSE